MKSNFKRVFMWFMSYASGLIFGMGLLIAGMSNPEKVLSFLDLSGHWDPSLALVMIGAIGISWLGYRLADRQTCALCGDLLHIPRQQKLDVGLILGSLAFGIGWGLTGICPGPALLLAGASVLQNSLQDIWIFIAAMLAGMMLFEVMQNRR